MPVMQIGVVGMPMHQFDVPVPMSMRLSGGIALGVLVLVMGIVTMPVLVFHRLVEVFMLVLFGQMQPKTQPHQAARDKQLHGKRLTQYHDRENGSHEGRE